MERKKNWKSDLLLRGKHDPVFWIENVLGDQLWERQKDICQSIIDHERTACVACFDDQTEILTETRGWQFFKDLSHLDKVASLENERMVFVSPLDYFEGEYNGEMIGYKSKQLDFLVTPDHRCLVSCGRGTFSLCGDWYIQTADQLPLRSRVYFNKSIIWDGVEDKWTEKHYELWGFWFADGSINGNYEIWITQKNHKDYVENLLSVYEQPVRVFNKGDENGAQIFSIGGKSLVDWFVTHFNRNKSVRRIPAWLKQAPVYKLKAFLRGFFMGDGCYFDQYENLDVPTTAVTVYYEDLAEDIAEVALRAGYGVTLQRMVKQYSDKQYGGVRQVVSWNISLLKNNSYLVATKQKFYRQPYKGKIYCVQVPSGLILVRRNGLYHWSGNSFGVGKTFLAARLAVWFLCTHKPSIVVSTAPTLRQVKDLLWSEIRDAHQKALIPIGGELLQLSLKFSERHFAVGFSTDAENMDKFTGLHQANQLVIFDQAGGIEPTIWEAAEGLMTSAYVRWLAISNSAISDGELANICMPDRKTRFGTWNVLRIKASESPNVVAGKNIVPGLVAYDWVKKREEAWGRDDPLYKIFVEAEFIPDSEMVVVPYKSIVAAFENRGELGEHIQVGLDVARMGTDSTVWTAISGSKVLEIKRLTGNTTMQVVGSTVEFVRHLQQKYQLPVSAVKVDVIGLGAGVYDRLVELDEEDIYIPAIAVNNAEMQTVIDRERYLNIRAEMAWMFRHRMEQGGVGFNDVYVEDYELKDYVRGDIQAMRYQITSQGKIKIIAKEDLRKILGRSPDYWDSLVMAFETPSGGPPSVEAINTHEEEESATITEEEWQVLLGTRMPKDDRFFRDIYS